MNTFTTTLIAVMAAPCIMLAAPAATADEAVATRTINLTEGQTHLFELPSNSTTGYNWQLATPLPEESAISIKIAPLPPKDNNVTVVGVPTNSLVSITGIKAGTTECKLIYVRSNEPQKEAKKSVSLKIIVK